MPIDNLTSILDRKGQTTTFSYDILSRMIKAAYGDGSYTDYAYDAGDRLTYVNDSVSGAMQYVYNNNGCSACGGGAADKVIPEITSLGSISYEYDAIGRRIKMQVAGQEPVTYQYDANSRLTQVKRASSPPAGEGGGEGDIFNLAYDSLGRRTSLTRPNGITTNYSYDNGSNLLELVHQTPQQIIEKLVYSYDKNSNRTNMDRLNMPVKLPNPASNTSYNQANQMLSFNDKNITYDENGNMLSVANTCGTTNYTWNARNQLAGINGFNSDCSSLIAAFKYDALGRRIEKTINGKTIQYLYDGADIVQEIENGTVTTNYIRTLNIDEPLAMINQDGIYHYIYDGLGSVIGLIDQSGNEVVQYYYDPFGNTTTKNPSFKNPFQYTGRENDNTGLYGYRLRYYFPELQRFISEDPIGFEGGDVNLYVYVGNNPVNYADPEGLMTLWIRPYPIIVRPPYPIIPRPIPPVPAVRPTPPVPAPLPKPTPVPKPKPWWPPWLPKPEPPHPHMPEDYCDKIA